MTGGRSKISGRTSVDTAVLPSESLEDQEAVKLSRLGLDIETIWDGSTVFEPSDLDG